MSRTTNTDIVAGAISRMQELWPNSHIVKSLDVRDHTCRDIQRLFEVFAEHTLEERRTIAPFKKMDTIKDRLIEETSARRADAVAERDRVLQLMGPKAVAV